MSEVARNEELVLPTGEIVRLNDPSSVAAGLNAVRDLESWLREFKGVLVDAIVEESRRQGTKTLHLEDGQKVEVKGGERVQWDAQQLEADLLAAGMPEDRVRQIIIEEVSYAVSAVKANQAARANPAYAEAVEGARKSIPSRPTITIKQS